MRLTRWCVIITFLFCASVYSQTVVESGQNNLGIYTNETREMYEEPVTEVGKGAKLTVVESTARNYKVRTEDGDVGWVEKRLVKEVSKSKAPSSSSSRSSGPSRAFVFDDAEVQGYLDNPAPVYIMDTDDPGSDPITLDRSFKDALKQNIDRETMEMLMR